MVLVRRRSFFCSAVASMTMPLRARRAPRIASAKPPPVPISCSRSPLPSAEMAANNKGIGMRYSKAPLIGGLRLAGV